MQNTRRQLIQTMVAGSAALALSACSTAPSPAPVAAPEPLSPEDQALQERFAVLGGGGELVVSTLARKQGVNMLDEEGRMFYARAAMGPSDTSTHPYSAKLGVPKLLHATWREGRDIVLERGRVAAGGVVVGDFRVQVASRIPEDLLEDLRRDPSGTFRLKIRLHDEGVLLGWDIERRPGYNPDVRDAQGNPVYVQPVHSFAGGDFCEAQMVNGKLLRKGWYLHPVTGKRIETEL